jgi:hypothetical protein
MTDPRINDEHLELELWRCVDGELDAADEARLLNRLEQTTDGWRRLARTFLDNRRLAVACRTPVPGEIAVAERVTSGPARPTIAASLTRSLSAAPPVGSRSLDTAGPGLRPDGWHAGFRLTAAALTLLGLGFLSGRFSQPPSPGHTADVARGGDMGSEMPANLRGPALQTSAASAQSGTPDIASVEHVSSADGPGQLDEPGRANPRGRDRPEVLLAIDQGDGTVSEVSVPVYLPHEAAAWQPELNRPLLPEAMQQAMKRAGFRIDQQRDLMVFPLDHSRQLAVPVDSVLVRRFAL